MGLWFFVAAASAQPRVNLAVHGGIIRKDTRGEELLSFTGHIAHQHVACILRRKKTAEKPTRATRFGAEYPSERSTVGVSYS